MKLVTKHMIGLKCQKFTRLKNSAPKPFKSGLKVNTIKGLAINPHTNNLAFTFEEDDSVVDFNYVDLLDDNMKIINKNDLAKQQYVHNRRIKLNTSV